MARSKHRRKGTDRPRRQVVVGNRIMSIAADYGSQPSPPGSTRPTQEELVEAWGDVPDDLGWDWAAPRLTPVFEHAEAGAIPGDPALHVVTSLGVAVGFGIEVGSSFARVTQSMASRWEASLEQIEAAAFRHLDDAVQSLNRSVLQHAVHRGHMVRCLATPAGWASSVILAGEDAVTRIFGDRDQVFTVPMRGELLSFDVRTPLDVVFELTALLEDSDPHALRVEPFVLDRGVLRWLGVAESDTWDLAD